MLEEVLKEHLRIFSPCDMETLRTVAEILDITKNSSTLQMPPFEQCVIATISKTETYLLRQ